MDDLGETARMFTAFHNEKLSKAQRLMADDGMPESGFLASDARAAKWRGRRLTKPSGSVKATKNEDPATARLREQMAAEKAKKQKERLSALREQKEAGMAAKKTATKKPARVASKVVKAKVTKKGAARKVAAVEARTPVRARESESSLDVVVRMMLRPGGATTQEMVDATGVQPHPLRSKIYAARQKGYDVTSPSKENGMRYFAKAPAP